MSAVNPWLMQTGAASPGAASIAKSAIDPKLPLANVGFWEANRGGGATCTGGREPVCRELPLLGTDSAASCVRTWQAACCRNDCSLGHLNLAARCAETEDGGLCDKVARGDRPR
jgi:hypothetical protein